MWQLHSDNNGKRIYKNSETNSECIQNKCYTDLEGNSWYEFQDLITIPHSRNFAANKVTALYALGLTAEDWKHFFEQFKVTLRSKDNGEKYERAYNDLLNFEEKFKVATNPVRQMSSLTCVYFTINDEPIDSFSDPIQIRKLSLMEADPQMHNFFLARQTVLIENYQAFLYRISQIASPPMELMEMK